MRRLTVAIAAALLLVMGAAPALAVNPPGDSAQADATVRAIAFGNNGNVYLGGEFTHMRPDGAPLGTNEVVRNHASAISVSSGSLQSWNPDVDGTVFAIEVVGSTVYLGGNFTSVGGQARKNLAAVSTSGALLPWAPSASGTVRVIEEGPNGNLFVGGAFSKIDGKGRNRVAEITPDGSLVDWKPKVKQVTGLACPPRCSPIVFTIDFYGDTVYLGGHFGLVNGVARNEAAAVPIDDGSNTLAWNPNIYAEANCPTCTTPETSRVYKLITTSSRVYMCGGFWRIKDGKDNSFNIYVTDLVTGNGVSGFHAGTDGDTPACAIYNGVLYAGGHFNWVGPICSQNPPPGKFTSKCTEANGSTKRIHVAAFDATTGDLLDWNPTSNSSKGPWTAEATAGALAWGGHFTRFGKIAQQGIAKYTSGFAT